MASRRRALVAVRSLSSRHRSFLKANSYPRLDSNLVMMLHCPRPDSNAKRLACQRNSRVSTKANLAPFRCRHFGSNPTTNDERIRFKKRTHSLSFVAGKGDTAGRHGTSRRRHGSQGIQASSRLPMLAILLFQRVMSTSEKTGLFFRGKPQQTRRRL